MITRAFNIKEIEKELQVWEERQLEVLANAMSFAATTVINDAKNNANYEDDTSNLRSSTGFLVVVNGKSYNQLFEGKNSKGVEKGKTSAREKVNSGETSIILTAGMEYATDVERKGFTVLSDFINPEEILKEIKYLITK